MERRGVKSTGVGTVGAETVGAETVGEGNMVVGTVGEGNMVAESTVGETGSRLAHVSR